MDFIYFLGTYKRVQDCIKNCKGIVTGIVMDVPVTLVSSLWDDSMNAAHVTAVLETS